ncbi:hypothetical protein RchiOBHm_Chr0c44g0503631 [Rosa chinensis]|uniref:Uncharacterized protein n=1 Tax=Rosa chinensis TaxID=74649 RepID=A0A2P6SQ42_ROSCH|nr:hypothetical protein RchiOBHm_Chr0c44g0503631 [Rosa chinensis]
MEHSGFFFALLMVFEDIESYRDISIFFIYRGHSLYSFVQIGLHNYISVFQ